jgi:hypothetical protein
MAEENSYDLSDAAANAERWRKGSKRERQEQFDVQHLALRYKGNRQKRSTPMVSPSTGSNRQESEPPSGRHSHHHRKGGKIYLYTVRSNKAKHEQLILSKTYPINMVINSRLLDIQGYKGFI